jgi:hypothetical protein
MRMYQFLSQKNFKRFLCNTYMLETNIIIFSIVSFLLPMMLTGCQGCEREAGAGPAEEEGRGRQARSEDEQNVRIAVLNTHLQIITNMSHNSSNANRVIRRNFCFVRTIGKRAGTGHMYHYPLLLLSYDTYLNLIFLWM